MIDSFIITYVNVPENRCVIKNELLKIKLDVWRHGALQFVTRYKAKYSIIIFSFLQYPFPSSPLSPSLSHSSYSPLLFVYCFSPLIPLTPFPISSLKGVEWVSLYHAGAVLQRLGAANVI